MVTRAVAVLSTDPDDEARSDAAALTAFAALDALTVAGEPIVSVYRTVEDGPYEVEVLFADTEDTTAQEVWLALASEVAGPLSFSVDPLGERDWVAESQKALHPVRAGPFVVHGSHDAKTRVPSRYAIQIDAGRAFGTAHHASTQGCLLALTALARRGVLGSVYDVGTGSGILAIAADRLGAPVVAASDIDPDAVRVAKENARAARVSQRFAVRRASGPVARADTVVANILARPLMAMAGPLTLAARRRLVLSGLRRRDRRAVLAAYRARGAYLERTIPVEDWVTLVLRTPPRDT